LNEENNTTIAPILVDDEILAELDEEKVAPVEYNNKTEETCTETKSKQRKQRYVNGSTKIKIKRHNNSLKQTNYQYHKQRYNNVNKGK